MFYFCMAAYFFAMNNKMKPIVIIVMALDRNGRPSVSAVAPETKEPATDPSEKKA